MKVSIEENLVFNTFPLTPNKLQKHIIKCMNLSVSRLMPKVLSAQRRRCIAFLYLYNNSKNTLLTDNSPHLKNKLKNERKWMKNKKSEMNKKC